MLTELGALYRRELLESVTPFWMKYSLDREHGGYFTCLDRDGTVYDTTKYVWLNGRQVWTLSRLYNEVEKRQEWLEAARLGAEFLQRHAFDTQGRCWFSLRRDGASSFYQRKPYAGVFVMLGFHEYWRATGDERYRAKALELYRNVQEWIADPRLLDRPALAGATCYSQLADIYVLCAMALELGDDAMLRQCLERVKAHYDPGKRILLENAGDRSYPAGRLVCVGSNFEIAWFVLRALDRVPNREVEELILHSVEGSLEFGWDREDGGFFYFQDVEGKPTLQLESNMKLWWVHAEAIYCLIVCALRTGDKKWLTWLERVHEYVWPRFRDPDHGEWYGYLDRRGEPTHTLKGNNYKGCFHIPRALLFSVQSIEQAAQSGRLPAPTR